MTYLITYALNLFDLAFTMYMVNRFGIEVEGNPIGRWLLATNLAVPFKTIGIGAAMLTLYVGVKKYPKWEWTSWFVLAVYSILAVYHLFILSTIL